MTENEKENEILVNSDVDAIKSQEPKLDVDKIGVRFIVERTEIFASKSFPLQKQIVRGYI